MKKYEGVLKRVREMEEKRGIKYATTDGKLYKTLKVFCVIFAVWALATNSLFILGNALIYSGTDNFKEITAELTTVSVCSVVIIASLILNRFKIYIVSAAINFVSSLLLCLQFGNLLTDSLGILGLKTAFYIRHLIPLAFMAILMVWMTVIAVRARVKTDRMYKKVTENLYDIYRVSDADAATMSDEMWDEFLQNYDPENKSRIVIVPEETNSQEETSDEG